MPSYSVQTNKFASVDLVSTEFSTATFDDERRLPRSFCDKHVVMDSDDIPDMSTPARCVTFKRPALALDTPKRASKRRIIGDGEEIGAGLLGKESLESTKKPQLTMAAFHDMQSRHLAVDLGDDTYLIAGSSPLHPLRIDDYGGDETPQLKSTGRSLGRSPGENDASFLSAKSTLDQSPLSPPTCKALQTLYSSPVKPVFKMRPSMGKLSWHSNILSRTPKSKTPKSASPFQPEKYRSLPPL